MLFNGFYKLKLFKSSLTIFLFLISISLFSYAEETIVFGPQNFVPQKGKSSVVTNSFSVTNPTIDYVLRVYNGGQENTNTAFVRQALISINGIQIIGKKDLNSKIGFIEKTVTLQTENIIEVEVKGSTKGIATVLIAAIAEQDNIIPNIEIIAPINGEFTNVNPYNVKLSFSDDNSGLDPDSVRILIKGINQTGNFSINLTDLFG